MSADPPAATDAESVPGTDPTETHEIRSLDARSLEGGAAVCNVDSVAVSYYDQVLRFADTVAAAGRSTAARAIEDAVRCGATRGQILTILAVALRLLIDDKPLAAEGLRIEAARLLDIADRALQRVGQVTPPPPKL